MRGWAIDLGSTNTGVTYWSDEDERPRLLVLPNLCRQPEGGDHLEAPLLIPSATHILSGSELLTRVGRWGWIQRRTSLGRRARIGREALELNEGQPHRAFAPSFKRDLGASPLRTLARAGGRARSAREVAALFLWELLAEIQRVTNTRPHEWTITTPVDAYESYRAELTQILQSFGVRRVRFLDEPVAAAIGYGLTLQRERLVLVVDFGGSTLDLALVRMTSHQVRTGQCEIIAKEGRPVGGDLVDRWLLDDFCDTLGYPLTPEQKGDRAFWYQMMLKETCRVKEQLFFEDAALFTLTPPEELRSFEARIRGEAEALTVEKQDLAKLLKTRGLYKIFEECLQMLAESAAKQDLKLEDVDDVLMVGGSTLLPGVYPLFEKRFGRDRVRAWHPFEAVAQGASAFAIGAFNASDFIVHDYAFQTYDLNTHDPRYTTIIPRGTRFPTPPDFWKRQLVPTCSLGEPEQIFKLIICEIGHSHEQDRRFVWDTSGQLHQVGGGGAHAEEMLVVPLNESNPTLGILNPPHSPGDRTPRLEIEFGINADRWLIATVRDLKNNKLLMDAQSIIRLL